MRRAHTAVTCLIALLLTAPAAGCSQTSDAIVGGGTAASAKRAPGAIGDPGASATSADATPPTPPPGAPTGQRGASAQPEIVADGAMLPNVRMAPPRTYAMFDLPKPFSGAEFVLIGRPYGWAGPDQAGARRLLLRVESAKALSGQTEKFADLTGQNVLVWVDPRTDGVDRITGGGTYRIEVRVRPSGATGVLSVASIQRTE